ncbi:MAG: PAS domain S-box protein [Negativicutes bacterium]
METSFLVGILNNVSLLLALGFLYSVCACHWDTNSSTGKLVSGFLFGAFAILGMLFPLQYSPGIAFDGRTILLGIIGLFGGWQAAAVAVLMTGALRLWQGGVGQWAGVATILSAAVLGAGFHVLRDKNSVGNGLVFVYGFGLIVHVAMLACMLILPDPVRWQVLSDISLPVLLVYPVAMMMYGSLINELDDRNRTTERLRESETKYRQLFEMESDALFLIDNESGRILDVNVAAVALYGYSRDELLGMRNIDLSAEPAQTRKAMEEALPAQVIAIPVRYHRKKDGTVFPVEINAAALLWNGRPAHIPAIRDITARLQAEGQLRESEARICAITDSAKDAILMMNPAGRISYWNPAAEEIFGYTKEEAMGESLHVLLAPQRYHDEHQTKFSDFLRTGRGEGVGATSEMAARHKDGHEIAIELSLSSIQLHDGWHSIGIIRDITKKLERREKIEYLSFHDQLTGLYNRRYYEEELRRLSTTRNLPITLVMADVNGLKLTNDAFGHAAGDELLKKLAGVLRSVCRADDIVARIGGDEFVLLLPMTDSNETEKIVQRIMEAISKEESDTIMLSVSFGWATKDDPVTGMADVFKMAEDYMYRHKLSESDSMRNNTIHIIVKTLNEKNEREERHSARVSELCKSIGIALELITDDINELKTAGLLHDIGKIGISEKVLNKVGSLTEDEWREMKRHSEIGYRILSAVPDFSHLAKFILEHHERWDGKGYPKNLNGQEICMEARILAVADAYDAMTDERPYRQPVAPSGAADEIRRQAGGQFDPMVARVFIEKVLGEAWNN